MRTVAVIPTLNEEYSIADVLKKVQKNVDKIIVVDSSSDRTPEIIKQNFPDVEIIFESRMGKGLALRKGFKHATDLNVDYVIMLDADGERNPDEIKKMIKVLENKNADMVVGCRKKMRSLSRYLLNIFTSFWVNLLTGYGLEDTLSGFNVIKKTVLKKMNLRSKRFEIETEMILEAYRHGLKVICVPIDVPNLSKSKCKLKNMLEINTFFDTWVLRWLKKRNCGLSYNKKLFLKMFCTLGLIAQLFLLIHEI
jgi:glycosyltransferase involved in cell wall biosynthesis